MRPKWRAPASALAGRNHVGPTYADVHVSVKITSTDARRHPACRFNYLSTANDRREWVEAIRCTRHILAQPAFGLRVVDASVFPAVTNANIYAPTMMVAEKAADLIRGDTPLPPSTAPFYRHEGAQVA